MARTSADRSRKMSELNIQIRRRVLSSDVALPQTKRFVRLPSGPHRPEAQDVALSRPKHGFESRWGRYPLWTDFREQRTERKRQFHPENRSSFAIDLGGEGDL